MIVVAPWLRDVEDALTQKSLARGAPGARACSTAFSLPSRMHTPRTSTVNAIYRHSNTSFSVSWDIHTSSVLICDGDPRFNLRHADEAE